MNSVTHQTAEREARRTARNHYENFPVASMLLPRRFRTPVALIYAFARRADDIADEGPLTVEQRLQQLQQMGANLDRARTGSPTDDPGIDALADAVARFDLPWQPLYDLLSAFEQDVTVCRYADYIALSDYCRRSANPIGRLLLHLYGAAEERNLRASDALCTALQLLNFIQDIDSDYHLRGRIYIPQEEMARFEVDEEVFALRTCDDKLRDLLKLQVRRAAALLDQGAPLAHRLPGRLGLELRAIVAAARRIQRKLWLRRDCFQRPTLHTGDWLAVAWSALRP